MAHKKGVGSSKNGRESESKRLGLRSLVGKQLVLETSSFVKEEPLITLAKMFI